MPAAADRRRRTAQIEEDKDDGKDDDGIGEASAVFPINLDELIEVSVRLAPELARSKADRATAQGNAQAARKPQEWVVTAEGKIERFAIAGDVEVGAFQIVGENTLTAKVGIGRNIPTGGNVGINFSVTDKTREFQLPAGLGGVIDPAIQTQIDNNQLDLGTAITDTSTVIETKAELIFKQPLARKFGSEVALADEKKGDLQFAAQTIKTQLAAEEMLKDVVIAYWELAYASEEVDIRQESLGLVKKQEELTRTELRTKLAPGNALSQVLFEVASREEAVLAAQGTWEKKSLELRKRSGLEINRRDLVIKPKDKFEVGNDEWDADDVLVRARKSNRKVASLILDKRAADVDVKVAKNGMLPQVDLTLSGALIGAGNNTNAAFSNAANSNSYQVLGSLTVNFEIGGAAKGAHDAATSKRHKIEVDQADAERQLQTDVVAAANAVKAARNRVSLADTAIDAAKKSEVAERENLRTGYGTNGATYATLFQRMNDVVNARLRRARAVADYHIAVANLQFHGGMLLEQYRVNVRPLPRGR